jgi:hypothetical protein
MKNKNWKIENGGKITVEITGKIIHVNCNGATGSTMSDDKEVYKKMMDFLLKYTNSKQANKIMRWVSEQVLSKEDLELVDIMNSVDKKIFR